MAPRPREYRVTQDGTFVIGGAPPLLLTRLLLLPANVVGLVAIRGPHKVEGVGGGARSRAADRATTPFLPPA